MINLLKSAFLLGVGVTSVTKDKIYEFAKNLSKDAKFSEEEGQKIIAEFLVQVNNSKNNINQLITSLIHEKLAQLDIPTRAELNDLDIRISKLENLIQDKQVEKQ